jgi:hypothetical protein
MLTEGEVEVFTVREIKVEEFAPDFRGNKLLFSERRIPEQ